MKRILSISLFLASLIGMIVLERQEGRFHLFPRLHQKVQERRVNSGVSGGCQSPERLSGQTQQSIQTIQSNAPNQSTVVFSNSPCANGACSNLR